MLVKSESSIQLLAYDEFEAPLIVLKPMHWIVLIASSALVFTALIVIAIDPRITTDPWFPVFLAAGTAAPLTVLASARFLIGLFTPGTNIGSATFDLDNENLLLVYRGVWGWSLRQIPLEEIQRLKLARGDWDGPSISVVPVAELETGESLVLPGELSEDELRLLQVLTGLRQRG